MKTSIYNHIYTIILIISIFLGLYRFYPYIVWDIALWYDPWLYRVMFLDYFYNLPSVDYSNLSIRTKSAYPPFLGLLWNILQLIWFKVDFILTFWLAFFSVITSVFIYLSLKKYSYYSAIFWVIIFFISIIQYESFMLNYYKQIIWIIFILSSLYLLEKKKYILSIPVIIGLFTIHRPSWLYFLALFILHKIINYKKIKNYNKWIYIVIFSIIVAFLMYIPFLKELIIPLLEPLFWTALQSWNSWTFFSRDLFWLNNYLIILVSLYWFYTKIIKKDFDYIFVWYLLWMIWVWMGLFFYSRIFIFYDLFIILIAAYWLWELYKKNNFFNIIFISFFILQSFFYINYVSENNKPYIWQKELEKIKNLDTILPEQSMIFTSHRTYTPWLYWYTHKPIIAPWMFEYDIWTVEDWEKWWSNDGKIKCEMIKDYSIYNKEIYYWLWREQFEENLDNWKCFELIYEEGDNKIFKINLNQNEW